MATVGRRVALSWTELAKRVKKPAFSAVELAEGPANPISRTRLFGKAEADIRVTLFRDNHGWCPYCQKIWLFLEAKRVPFRVKKVTMFCYGQKEQWYKRVVPSGMLPAIELDGHIVTESDDILEALEREFGPLYKGMTTKAVVQLRQLERHLFRAWCSWLCYPSSGVAEEEKREEGFVQALEYVEHALSATDAPFFLDAFSVVDCVFTPYVERMSASLFYYKGFTMRDPTRFPNVCRWFDGMESLDFYRGTQSDFHTHVHDLPPQMGGCYHYAGGLKKQTENLQRVDTGPWVGLPDTGLADPEDSVDLALARVVLHKDSLIRANPAGQAADEPLRCALTAMLTGEQVVPETQGADAALRYIRDRVNVPRDMPVWSARHLRGALESTAKLAGPASGPPIPTNHRRDQSPATFHGAEAKF